MAIILWLTQSSQEESDRKNSVNQTYAWIINSAETEMVYKYIGMRRETRGKCPRFRQRDNRIEGVPCESEKKSCPQDAYRTVEWAKYSGCYPDGMEQGIIDLSKYSSAEQKIQSSLGRTDFHQGVGEYDEKFPQGVVQDDEDISQVDRQYDDDKISAWIIDEKGTKMVYKEIVNSRTPSGKCPRLHQSNNGIILIPCEGDTKSCPQEEYLADEWAKYSGCYPNGIIKERVDLPKLHRPITTKTTMERTTTTIATEKSSMITMEETTTTTMEETTTTTKIWTRESQNITIFIVIPVAAFFVALCIAAICMVKKYGKPSNWTFCRHKGVTKDRHGGQQQLQNRSHRRS